jgi:hypothetical protein
MVDRVSHDSSPPPLVDDSARTPDPLPDHAEPTVSRVGRQHGFVLVPAGDSGPLRCRDVLGFREAVLAAEDPRAPTPARLVLVGPDEETCAWLDRWSEDVEQVRRRLTLRHAGGIEVSLVATLASFGCGVATSLAVESIQPLAGGAILRSGVHSRAEVEAALADYGVTEEEERTRPGGSGAEPPSEAEAAEPADEA